jgi:hypothetical protein
MLFESTIKSSPLELPTYIRSPCLSNVAAVGVKGDAPSANLLRGLGAEGLDFSDTETGRNVVLPVSKSTSRGAEDRGHAKQIDGVGEPG